jgi:hypothetical protein
MDRSAVRLLEFVARLTYNVHGLSGQLKLYFSQFLTFHFSKVLSASQIQQVENQRASKPLTDEGEIANVGRDLSESDRCWAIAAIDLLRKEAERVDDRIVSRRLATLTSDLGRILNLGGLESQIESQMVVIELELRKYQERPVVRIPAAIWPMSLLFILYFSVDLYDALQGFNWSVSGPLSGIGIPAIVIGLVIFLRRKSKKANRLLLEKYGGAENYKVEFRITTAQYSWLAFYLMTITFIGYLLAGTHKFGPVHTYYFTVFSVLYFVYLRYFNVGRISENELVRQLEGKEQHTKALDVDENDEMIVSLETRLHASTSRLDAYVLESALFGALTFSGFLQIMASDLVSFGDLESFATNIFNVSQAAVNLDGAAFTDGLTELNNKVSLFCLVSVESLICSIFFLAVIASRLRFSDIADRVRTAINLAQAFNTKEEALYHESETSDIRQSRLLELTGRVNRQLFEANSALRQVDPVVAYMEYFRNAGIMVFFVILVSSSLFITSVLGWAFLALLLATYLYFNRESLNLRFKAFVLQFRIYFLRRALVFLIVAISPFFLAAILRNSFYWLETPGLMALGWFLVGLHLMIWLLFAAHYDEGFGDIESKENRRRMSRWKLVRNLLATAVFLFCVGMVFKQLHFAGADEFIMIGASALSPLMFFAGYFLSRIRWLGVISGWMLSTASIGVLFQTLHLNGSQEMLLIGTIAGLVFSIIMLLKRKQFHSLFLRFCLVLTFVSVTDWLQLFPKIEIAYAHRTTEVAPIMKVFYENGNGFYLTDSVTSRAIAATEWYLAKYDKTVPFSAVYRELVRMYNVYGRLGVERAELSGIADTTQLKNALVLTRERDKIVALYNYQPFARLDVTLEPDILLLLNRKEEAIQTLSVLLKRYEDKASEHRELAAKLASIRAL